MSRDFGAVTIKTNICSGANSKKETDKGQITIIKEEKKMIIFAQLFSVTNVAGFLCDESSNVM